MLKRILFLTALCAFSGASAGTSLTAVTPDDLDAITKEFSANFSHQSVMGASTLGSIFGFEVALLAGQSPSPETDKIVKRSSSSDSLPTLYHAGLLAAVSVPFGFTGELIYTPKMTSQGLDFQETSMALKWTLDESLIVIPFNLAFRGFLSTSTLSFKDTVGAIDGTINNKNTVTGFQILASPKLPIFEPYVGVGYLQAKDTLDFSGSGTIFGGTIPATTTSQDATASSTQFLVGIDVHVLLLSLGAEYSKAFGSDSYTAKLGFAF
jgi:hypothetical protein